MLLLPEILLHHRSSFIIEKVHLLRTTQKRNYLPASRDSTLIVFSVALPTKWRRGSPWILTASFYQIMRQLAKKTFKAKIKLSSSHALEAECWPLPFPPLRIHHLTTIIRGRKHLLPRKKRLFWPSTEMKIFIQSHFYRREWVLELPISTFRQTLFSVDCRV